MDADEEYKGERHPSSHPGQPSSVGGSSAVELDGLKVLPTPTLCGSVMLLVSLQCC